jgi:predicted TIM-barrel fold metal-dependent hydrolase
MILREMALSGKTLENELVIDAHMHPHRLAKFFSPPDIGATVNKMDRIGVKHGIFSKLYDIENLGRQEDVFRILEEYPGRFYGYITPDPHRDDFLKELEKWAKVPRFVGIKLHPSEAQKPIDCKEYLTAYAFGAERSLPVLMHTWGMADIAAVEKLVVNFPRTVLIIGHSGGERNAVEYAIRLARDYANVYLDTTRTFCYNNEIIKMIEGVTDRKILFGSDATWNSMEAAIGRILLEDIPDESKRRIIGQNAKEVFSLDV